MGVKIMNPEQIQVPKPQAKQPAAKVSHQAQAKSETTILVEEILTIHNKLVEMHAIELMDRYDEVKKLLQEKASSDVFDALKPVTFHSDLGDVTYGPRSKKNVPLGNEAIVELIGKDVALAICKFGVTELKKYLTAEQLSKVTSAEFGSRTLKAVNPKGSEAGA